MRGVHALAVIQPRVFVRSEKEKRVLTSLGVQIGPACQARRSISTPTIPHRVLNFGVFVPDALLACRLVSNGAKFFGQGWHAMSAPVTSVSRCSPRVAADLVRPERHVPSRELVWSRTRPFRQSTVEERWHRRAARLRLLH